jgi:hypothetical protein
MGQQLSGLDTKETINALGEANGMQILASKEQIEQLKTHICSYTSSTTDLREKIRNVEMEFFENRAGMLIGNQCIDFQKQDGVTEIEEAIMANIVERRLNDLLLRDERNGKVIVNRKPMYVSCVSNFTNFLDLSRKTLRSLEVGIPCVILGRTNTSQHCYRWAKLLIDLMIEQGVDPGMVTFLSCTLDDMKHITQSCQEYTGNLYTTCSRELAADIKVDYPNTVASTGGPNTFVALNMSDKISDAIRTSASIESSGQCTALRHCVVPHSTNDEDLDSILQPIKPISDAQDALRERTFDRVFKNHDGSARPESDSYKHIAASDVYFKIGVDFPMPSINEYWRRVVVDFTKADTTSDEDLSKLASWLNRNQPISLAFNGPQSKVNRLGIKLWEMTGMVVYTIGSSDNDEMPPALTCQARPQEGGKSNGE